MPVKILKVVLPGLEAPPDGGSRHIMGTLSRKRDRQRVSLFPKRPLYVVIRRLRASPGSSARMNASPIKNAPIPPSRSFLMSSGV